LTQQSLFGDTDLVGKHQRIQIPDAELSFFEQAFTTSESEQYFAVLARETPWRADHMTIHGKNVPLPRLQAWYGAPGATLNYSGMSLQPLAMTTTLAKIGERVFSLYGIRFNGVLVNFYRDGNDSVGWHSDNETEFGPNPIIASVSFGASRDFVLKHLSNGSAKPVKCLLTNGSLLVMGDSVQAHWKHQLPKRKRVTEGRINLTFRNIV
jgi:alkylated DNA repair dioxygenase AlkB